MNDPRGSVWRKWDLHVHTPDSLVQRYGGATEEIWKRYIDALSRLPSEFKVLGINDYIFLDGYKKVLAAKMAGKLPNIELLLPVIELRLDKFGGTKTSLSRVNYHVIFSDQIPVDTIESQFLGALNSKYELTPALDLLRKGKKWSGIPTRKALEDLGQAIIESVPMAERPNYCSPIIEGFNNLCLRLDSIQEVLSSPYFADKVITAVGKAEWADIKWNDHSIADKKTIINGANLVFISSSTTAEWIRAKKSLEKAGVNDRLLDCSDAHSFSDSSEKDRLGNCFTWIKADPTFEGLLQVVNEPNERCFIGDLPPKLKQVQRNRTKYISDIQIRRKPTATLSETWFDNNIPLNPDLVAIIGNKGKGKSALVDIIGLLANSKQYKSFTFLTEKHFRHPKDNKAKHFDATLTWESGSSISKGLDEAVDEQQPELVKYIPQNFLENICNEIGKVEESDFDKELKKVIFSHVDVSERLEKSSLDELINYRTSEAIHKMTILRQELHKINEAIVQLEEKSSPKYVQEVKNLLKAKQDELSAHESAKPREIIKPENDEKEQKEIIEITSQIEIHTAELKAIEQQIEEIYQKQKENIRLIATTDRLLERLDNLEHQIEVFSAESEADFTTIGVDKASVIKVVLEKGPIQNKRTEFVESKKQCDKQLNITEESSLVASEQRLRDAIQELQIKLDEPNRLYQEYLATLTEWEKKRSSIIGNKEEIGSIQSYEDQLQFIRNIPELLTEQKQKRMAKTKEIYQVLSQLAEKYRELYLPVNQFIDRSLLAKDKFQLKFEACIVDSGFQEKFFDIVSQAIIGTFYGVEEGHKAIADILARHDFNQEAEIEKFLDELTDALENDKRPGGKPVKVDTQLKKGKSILNLYDMLFALDYMHPRYALKMGDKELSELSPGERGTLLLVFYLLVDKDDIPLVIDQPEENLDNQTIYELLVPCIKEAKQRRQIVIVTHNPNLAVVCDAEQVVFANLDKKNNYTMHYASGAIENPQINKPIVDVLEGTMPAFDNRDSKYRPIEGRY